MAIDSHMHINSSLIPTYIKNIDNEINNINNDKYISGVINVGLDIPTSIECNKIAKNNSKFYSAVGIHPLYVDDQSVDILTSLITDKTVAIGEIGLDSGKGNYLDQKRYLILQIILANQLGLPVIIHSNGTNKEVIEIFEKYVKPKYGCVFHCFQPDIDDLNYLISNGFYVSFAGKITYPTACKSLEVLEKVPNNLFMVETDSPYIGVEPYRAYISKTSDIKYIIDKVSEVKGISVREVENITESNVRKLFKKMR